VTAPILTVEVDGVVVCEFARGELPAEKTPSVAIRPLASEVVFREADGTAHRHTLHFEEGWVHLSARVHETLICQPDCLISDSSEVDTTEFTAGKIRGIRFQPFILKGSKEDPSTLVGQGLFARGFHYGGRVSPGNLSLSCICDSCHSCFRLQSFHTGFMQAGYFYSQSGRYTLTVAAAFVDDAPAPLQPPDPQALVRLEGRLPLAPDGTRFSYLNPLRCPHCQAPYIDFPAHPDTRPGEYYGNTFYGEPPLSYGEPPR
jgi:hypothetical protein